MTFKFKINVRNVLMAVAMLFLLSVSFLDNTIYALSVKLDIILVLFSFFLIVVSTKRLALKADVLQALLLLSALVVLFRNRELERRNFLYTLTYLTLVLIAFSAGKSYTQWGRVFVKFLFCFGIVATFFTYLFFLLPDLYVRSVLPTVEPVYYQSLLYCIRQGFQPGFAVHYSSNGMFLAVFIGLILSLYLKPNVQSVHSVHRGYILVGLVAMIALFLTAKRAHILFALFAGMVVYYIHNSDRKVTRIFKITGIIMAGVIGFVITAQYIPSIGNVVDRFIEGGRSGDMLNNRGVLYEFAIGMFRSNPIFGSGWGSYKYTRDMVLGDYNNAHNVFLQLLAETGIVGTVIFVALFVVMLYYSIQTYRTISLRKGLYTPQEHCLAAFSVFMQCFFLMYCLTGNPLYDRVVWVPVMLSAICSRYILKNRRITNESQ